MMMEVGRTEAEEQEELRRQIHNFENDPSVHMLQLMTHRYTIFFLFFIIFPSICVQFSPVRTGIVSIGIFSSSPSADTNI